ncbi:twin-arginine translocase subunit TatC [Tepidibacter mesophilus]|uniref:twin-arginine translocase subunit TatC n=1 Tax=Tepidibacter mesophilus TaxID=655607 RepID=UPI000C06A099|nr:twin-arginine translocase subunit TatC [Tepidibacter mesophilus]
MEDSKFTIIEHLDELRKRIIIIVISILIGTGSSYIFIEELVDIILKPAVDLDFIYISPPELFLEYIKIAFVFGVGVSIPIIMLQTWLFIKPGLKKKEKFFILFSMIMGLIFFVSGISFAYFIITPLTLKFFANMSLNQISPLFSFSNYIKFISSLLVSFGLVFELPMIVILLTQLNLVTPFVFKKYRKIVILIVFILASLLTPPDVISQILLGVPMALLYELSILFSVILYNRKQKS